MKDTIWDVVIIGAGAAGFMTAITAKRRGLKVLLLDGKEKIGAKILMSGGTRCNVTNQKVLEGDFQTEAPRTIRNILSAFSSEKAVQFFKDLGVEVVLEDGGKFFPSTHSGKTVLDALMKEASQTGVHLQHSSKVKRIERKESFEVGGDGFTYLAKNVVLCTGGLSYPQSGSDGVGYEIAKSFGHHLIETSPSLTPLTTNDADWKSISGLSLPVRLAFFQNGKKEADYEGSFLFTHFGYSGPVVLNISRHWIRATKNRKIEISFVLDEEKKFRENFLKNLENHKNKVLKNVFSGLFPERFIEVMFEKLRISPNLVVNQLDKKSREEVLNFIFHYHLPVDGAIGYAKAEVTAGGVDFSEVNSKTLESKLQPGLFFAGEILDVDGRIGGFNFQWAWSSGFVVGNSILK